MQRVKVHELRKLSESDLVDRLTKERVSRDIERVSGPFGVLATSFGC